MNLKLRSTPFTKLVLPLSMLGLAACSDAPAQDDTASTGEVPTPAAPGALAPAEPNTVQPQVATDEPRLTGQSTSNRQPTLPVAASAPPAETASGASEPTTATLDHHAGHDMTNHEMEGMHSQ